MARPVKPAAMQNNHGDQKSYERRKEREQEIQGGTDLLVPPDYLTEPQKEIFVYIRDLLKQASVLGNLDLFILTQLSIVTDRLTSLEKDANQNPDNIYTKEFIAARRQYSTDFVKYCSELCLSPQARAKLSFVATGAETQKKTLADILKEE